MARTVASRGSPCRRASSPKAPPGPYSSTFVSSDPAEVAQPSPPPTSARSATHWRAEHFTGAQPSFESDGRDQERPHLCELGRRPGPNQVCSSSHRQHPAVNAFEPTCRPQTPRVLKSRRSGSPGPGGRIKRANGLAGRPGPAQ